MDKLLNILLQFLSQIISENINKKNFWMQFSDHLAIVHFVHFL